MDPEAAHSHAAPIHVLLTDVVMPRMSRGRLAASLNASRPDLAVVYMSGDTDDALLRKLREVLDEKT